MGRPRSTTRRAAAVTAALIAHAAVALLACAPREVPGDAAPRDGRLHDGVSDRGAPRDARPRDVLPGAADAAPPGCRYLAEKVCWMCGAAEKSPWQVGCRGPRDCLLFCSEKLAPGFTRCEYRGPLDSGGDCHGWVSPRGPLSSCVRHEVAGAGWAYACPWCWWGHMSYEPGWAADGTCAMFAGGCRAEGYTLPGPECW